MRRRWAALLLGVLAVANLHPAERYMRDVLEGKAVVGRLTRLAIERQVRDLERQNTKSFPFYFDAKAAQRVIGFKQQLTHVDGQWKGSRIRLEPWQQFKDWVLFGWKRSDSSLRRFRKSYISVAKKNGKTTDAATTALFMFYADRPKEGGPQVYCVGPKKEQGKISWEIAAAMVKAHPVLKGRARFFKENTNEPRMLLKTDPRAVMTVWGKDAATQDGFSPSMAIVDEAHLYPGHEAMETLESGMGARAQPLTYVITTAGFDLESPCYVEENALAIEVLEGTADPIPEHLFAIIYTLDEEDKENFADPKVWPKANPNLGITPRLDFLRNRVTDALSTPTKLNDILTKNFNIWTHAETRWIAPETWAACDHQVLEEQLAGRRCYGGLDLSMARDLTAWVLSFWPSVKEPDVWPFLYRFFLPADNIVEREREDRRAYREWADRGLITLTPGPQVDYGVVEETIKADAQRFDLQQLAYDPYRAGWLVAELAKHGSSVEAIEYPQRYTHMAVPTALFERAVIGKGLAHGGNPVMKWMISCTEVKSDRQGLIMPMKPKRGARGKRIDGVVASIMAYHRAFSEYGKAQEKVEVWAV